VNISQKNLRSEKFDDNNSNNNNNNKVMHEINNIKTTCGEVCQT